MPGMLWVAAAVMASALARLPVEGAEAIVLEDLGDHAVLLSVGRAHEVRPGDVLRVFRPGPQRAYLGAVRLTAVSARYSVGRFIQGPRQVIRMGDQVSLPREVRRDEAPGNSRPWGALIWDR